MNTSRAIHLLPAVVSVNASIRESRASRLQRRTRSDLRSAACRKSAGRSSSSSPFCCVALLVTHLSLSIPNPTRRTSRCVVGGWNLLNLVLAGCALGVVSERGELSATRRVKVTRQCEFGLDEHWYPATIDDVSVYGARINVYAKTIGTPAVDTRGLDPFHAPWPRNRRNPPGRRPQHAGRWRYRYDGLPVPAGSGARS